MFVFHLSEPGWSLIRKKSEYSPKSLHRPPLVSVPPTLASGILQLFQQIESKQYEIQPWRFPFIADSTPKSSKHELIPNDLFPNNTDANYNKSSPFDT